MRTMLELFEKTLVSGGDLEQARGTLLNQANIDHFETNQQIEHDFKIAVLIRECLTMEPKGSSGYGCAKGILNRLKGKYQDPAVIRAKAIIRKELKEAEKAAREENVKNDSIDEEQTESPAKSE